MSEWVSEWRLLFSRPHKANSLLSAAPFKRRRECCYLFLTLLACLSGWQENEKTTGLNKCLHFIFVQQKIKKEPRQSRRSNLFQQLLTHGSIMLLWLLLLLLLMLLCDISYWTVVAEETRWTRHDVYLFARIWVAATCFHIIWYLLLPPRL